MVSTFLGAMLREAREAAGSTLAGMAKRTGYSLSHLANLESGHRDVKREHLDAYVRALGESEEDMERRALLATISKLAVVTPAAVVAEQIRQGLMAELGIREWPELVDEYGRRFLHGAPAIFHNRLAGDLIQLRAAMQDTPEWTAVAARLFTLYAADAEDAPRWYRAAKVMAERSGDIELIHWVCGRQVFRLAYAGHDPDWLLTEALDIPTAEARLCEAQLLARLGQRTASLEALGAARRHVDETATDTVTIYHVSPWRLAINTAYVYGLLGDTKGSERALSEAIVPKGFAQWEYEKELVRAVALQKAGDPQAGKIAEQTWTAAPEEIKTMVTQRFYQEATR